MNAKIKSENLRVILESVKDLLDDCVLECNQDGITMQAMDTAHVSLCIFFISKDSFEEYTCSKNISLGLKLQHLLTIVKCCNDSIILTADNTDVLNILNKQKEFELKLMDINIDQINVEDSDYECTTVIKSSELKNIINDIKTIDADTTRIIMTNNSITFVANSMFSKINVNLNIEGTGSYESEFSTKYLNLFTKNNNLSDTLLLKMDPSKPLCLVYDVGSSFVKYFLAPKMDDNDNT